jgi:hypothetical protein
MTFIYELLLIGLFGIVGFIILIIFSSVSSSREKDYLKKELNNLKDFDYERLILSHDNESGIAIDENRKTLVLFAYNYNKEIEFAKLPFKDLLACEIFEDGTTVTRSSRSSQLGRAVLGGLTFGGVGAIIGGLSGKKVSSDKISRIDLRLTVNWPDKPIHDINLMNYETGKDSTLYQTVMENARTAHAFLELIIRNADIDDKSKLGENDQGFLPKTGQESVADELKKLSELKNEGILTEDEFVSQKTKLLS